MLVFRAEGAAVTLRLGERIMRKNLVSIINYRTADMTCDCLHSVLDDMADLDGEVVIALSQLSYIANHPGQVLGRLFRDYRLSEPNNGEEPRSLDGVLRSSKKQQAALGIINWSDPEPV